MLSYDADIKWISQLKKCMHILLYIPSKTCQTIGWVITTLSEDHKTIGILNYKCTIKKLGRC